MIVIYFDYSNKSIYLWAENHNESQSGTQKAVRLSGVG